MPAQRAHLFALKNEGGSDSVILDLGRTRQFLAFGSVTMVDSLTDFDRDNAYAFDIFRVDGAQTSSQVFGGDHWGPAGSGNNVFEGAVVRTGRRIECWLRTIHSQDLDTFGVAVAITLD